MIPQEQLLELKPLPDIIKRNTMIKKKMNKLNPIKIRLSKRARQWADYPAVHQKSNYNGPRGERK